MKQLYHGCQDISKSFNFLWEKSKSIRKIVEYGKKSLGIGKIMEFKENWQKNIQKAMFSTEQ